MRPQDIKKKITEQESSMAGDAEALERYNKSLKTAKADIKSYEGQVLTA
jgi:hypothetical protein